jgi:hypothetical protein
LAFEDASGVGRVALLRNSNGGQSFEIHSDSGLAAMSGVFAAAFIDVGERVRCGKYQTFHPCGFVYLYSFENFNEPVLN